LGWLSQLSGVVIYIMLATAANAAPMLAEMVAVRRALEVVPVIAAMVLHILVEHAT